ncbi:MAG TPA: helix-turn-helix transcriptional regulator, partial [Candidatus Binatia bacterium]|nr:helix-turn-helix transcriptional regulator [Candidatus Binatia bacterium]
LRLIERGFLDDGQSVEDLADTLGMTPRHLRRLFERHAGASPSEVATTRRVQRAKALVDTTALPMSAIAFAAGFASIRRFNAAFRAVYRRPPSALRRARRARPTPTKERRPHALEREGRGNHGRRARHRAGDGAAVRG